MFFSYAKFAVVFFIGFLTTLCLTPLVMKLAIRIGMVDRPDERRIHKKVIPSSGGIAVFLGFHLACAAIYFLPWPWFTIRLNFNVWLTFLPASAFLLLVGIVDDYRGLRPLVKLGCQTIAALALYIGGFRIGGIMFYSLPWYVSCALTVFWCLGFINAFNLIDGLDGLATGLGIIAAAGLTGALLLHRIPGDALVLLGLIGACLGFLRYNFAPAKVFLGDSGSMFIGFTLAAISLWSGYRGTVVTAMSIPLLAAGVPILDTALAIWRRSMQHLNRANDPIAGSNGFSGAKVFSADTDHLHHRLLRVGWTHKRVAWILYLLNVALVAVGLLAVAFHSLALAIYMVTFVVATYVVIRHLAHVELWHSGMAVLTGLRRPPRRAIAVMLYPALDLTILALTLAVVLILTPSFTENFNHLFLSRVAIWVTIPFLIVAGSGAYRRVWSRARILDFVTLIIAFSGGVWISVAVSTVLIEPLCNRDVLQAFLFWGIGLVGLACSRLLPYVMQDILPFLLRNTSIEADLERVPCLVYGAGRSGTLFLRDSAIIAAIHVRQRIVIGLLDDDPNVYGRTVYGYRVFGGIERLEQVVGRYGIKEIVITTHLNESAYHMLKQFAETHDVHILRWRTEIRPMFSE